MIETYTIYDFATGEISRMMQTGSPDLVALNIAEGESFIDGEWNASTHYVAFGEAVEMPPRPSDSAVFDHGLKAWTEPFTPEQLLQQRRELAVIDRFTFCTRCREQGILSVSDALALGHGQIPPATRAILDTMSPADSFDAELRWASMTTVRRLDPLIVATMAATGIPDIMLDHLFDVYPYQSPEVTP